MLPIKEVHVLYQENASALWFQIKRLLQFFLQTV